MEEPVIRELKVFINIGDIEGIKERWREYQEDYEFETPVAWDYVFQKIYLHACLKKQPEIAKWLQETIFPLLNPITQIALRQAFSYGKHLLNK